MVVSKNISRMSHAFIKVSSVFFGVSRRFKEDSVLETHLEYQK